MSNRRLLKLFCANSVSIEWFDAISGTDGANNFYRFKNFFRRF